jgi:2',3'-cyclic-nucleotide 2'-phosphodiesterase (5'-nucleotidase family)
MKRKKFTILHSNDMHGDFFAEISGRPGELIGGLALLSGYINKVRREERKRSVCHIGRYGPRFDNRFRVQGKFDD